MPNGATSLILQVKFTGQGDSSYASIAAGLAGGAVVPVDLNSGTDYTFRAVALSTGLATPGATSSATTLSTAVGWGAGNAINCSGIRWPFNGATLPAGGQGRLISYLATDWDLRQTSIASVLQSSSEYSDPCTYTWSAVNALGQSVGSFLNDINQGQSVVWIAPNTPTQVTLRLVVDDQNELNQANGDLGSRDDADHGYDDSPLTFTVPVTVQ